MHVWCVSVQEVDMQHGVLCGRSVWQLPHGKAPVVRLTVCAKQELPLH
jgi:hypothetical protein